MQLPESVTRQAAEAKRLQAELVAPAAGAGGNGSDKTTAPQAGELETLRAENTRLTAANSVLQGKYNAELPREIAKSRDLELKLKQATDELAKLKQDQEQARQQAVDPAKLDLTQYYTADEIDERGEDVLRTELARSMRVANTLVSNHVAKATDAIRTEITPIKEDAERERERKAQETAVARETAQDKFVAELNVALPNWEAQNEDPGFLAWLNVFDANLGGSRLQHLQGAHHQMDAAKVIEVFKAYRESRDIGVAKKAPQPKIDPGPGGGGSETPPTNEKRKWTRAEVAQFNHDSGPGRKYVGREAERRQIEQDIFMAGKEGRVIG